jgi:phage tail-like protein
MQLQKTKAILISLVPIFGTACIILGCFTNVDAKPDKHESSTASKLYFEASGIEQKSIKEVSGLEVDLTTPIKVPPRQATPTTQKLTIITLKLVATSDLNVYKWYEICNKNTGGFSSCRKNATVTVYDSAGQMQSRWEITNCYPAKYTGPTLTASSDKVATETIELVHEGIKRVDVK